MHEKNRIEKIWKRYNALRGYTSQTELPIALFLIKKVKEEFQDSNKRTTEQKLYESMLSIADGFGMKNPYANSKEFYTSYLALEDEEIDLEATIASADIKEMFYVPTVVVDEFEKYFDESSKEVLIPEAEKFVPHIGKLVRKYPESEFTLTTMNVINKILLDEVFKDVSNVEVIQTSIYDYEFSAKKFDLIFSVPVFGVRERKEDSDFLCSEYEMIALENLLLHLNSQGLLRIILPARITFAGGSVKDLREFVQSMYKLDEIAELPAGIFSSTAIKTYMFTIKTGRTDDVIVKRFDSDTKNIRKQGINELISVDDTFVMLDELVSMGDWNVDHIFSLMDEEWQKYLGSSIKKEELGNVADVFRGKAVNKKEKNGRIAIVNISNFNDYYIDYESLDYFEAEERKISNYLLEDGDLLLPARGTRIKTAIFKEQKYPCIASSNVIVIRPNSRILSGTYLKVFLDSPMGNKILSRKQQGTVVINISYKDLKLIEIPILDIEKQNTIATEYEEELEEYLDTLRKAEERWNKVKSKLQNKVL